MNSNAKGTLLRIIFIAIGLFCFWFFSINILYFLVAYIIDMEYSFLVGSSIFILVMVFRMFYPKNVFV